MNTPPTTAPAYQVTARPRRGIGVIGWTVIGMLLLIVLLAYGVWVAMELMGQSGPVRIVIDGQEVFDGMRWGDWARENQLGFSIVVGFTLALVLVFVLAAIGVALLLGAVGGAAVILATTAPIWIPVLVLWWWFRRDDARQAATAATASPQ